MILVGLVIWMVIVTAALFLPAGNVAALPRASALAIGIVLGGTQALSRSYFSLLIPRGKEAEYFCFYHAMDRGTSWFGTADVGDRAPAHRLLPPGDLRAHRLLRPRRLLLMRVDTARGIRDAGNDRAARHLTPRSSGAREGAHVRAGTMSTPSVADVVRM